MKKVNRKSSAGKRRKAAGPRATRNAEMGLTEIGRPVPLREAVDDAIDSIEGIVRECREAMDRAIVMHVYATGRCGGDCSSKWDVEENVNTEFNDAMAEAAGALKCLLSYVDNIRPDALSRADATKLEGATVGAAAEE
jgi:hypothetical protein